MMWKASDEGATYWVIADSAEKAEIILRECYPAEDVDISEPLRWQQMRPDEMFTYHFDDGRTVTLEAGQWCDLIYTSAGFVACFEW